MPTIYSLHLYTISALIAVWASCDTLRLAGRMDAAQSDTRPTWVIAGALTMGIGVWSTHFVGMLALGPPVSIRYDVSRLILSVLIAIASAGGAFVVVSRELLGRRTFWAGGTCIGVAICATHYTTTAAMRMPALVRYTPGLVMLSALIAIGAACIALRLAFDVPGAPGRGDARSATGPGALMGLGIFGMHYTATAAAQLAPVAEGASASPGALVAATPELAIVVALGTAAMLGMADLGIVTSRREEQMREGEEGYRARFRALAARSEAAREEERTRIAREIHDALGQTLTVIKLDVALLSASLAERRELNATFRDMSATLDDALEILRRLASELRPPMLSQLGLHPAIAALAREFEARTGVRAHLDLPPDDGKRLDEHMATAAYRIVQEALTNVARHARATRVDIAVRLTPRMLDLEVRDDGRGITHDEVAGPRSLGLLGMRERAEHWGGRLSVTGRPGRGTMVKVTIPVGKNIRERLVG